MRLAPQPGAYGRRPCWCVACGEGIGRRVHDAVRAPPWGAFHDLVEPAACIIEIALAGNCPPRERSPQAGKRATLPRALSPALYRQRAAANPDQEAGERHPLG